MKPTEWLVYFGSESLRFTCRARARGFAIICKARGDENVRIVARGY